jgi:ribosomal protein S18 acetylase RimI-like enzyme
MITIKKATIQDLTAVVELFDKYRVFYEKASDKVTAANFLSQRLKQEDSQIFVAETDTLELVGFVQLYPLFSSTRMRKLWLLNDLFIDQEYRGRGISKQLIDAAKDLCIKTDACGLILETAKTNTIGNELYPRTGFTLDNDHNYYSWDND